MRRRQLLVASLYALAFFVTQVSHELAHAVAGLMMHDGPVLHTAYVEHTRDVGDGARAFTALAGPLFSLVQGIVLTLYVRARAERTTGAGGVATLWWTWLAYHGLVNFVGYVFTTSFATGADMGKAATLLGVPDLGMIAMTVLGLGGLRLLVRPLALPFVQLAPTPINDKADAWSYTKSGVMGPAILATVALAIAAQPVPHWLSLVYVFAAFFPLFDLPDALLKVRERAHTAPLPEPAPWWPAAVYVLTVVVFRLALDGGVAL